MEHTLTCTKWVRILEAQLRQKARLKLVPLLKSVPCAEALSPEGQTLENWLSPFFSVSRFVDGDELRSVSKGGGFNL
jgi:hypothetical protein